MFKSVLYMAFIYWIFGSYQQLLALESKKERPLFTHSVDLRLLWLDDLRRPLKGLNSENDSQGGADAGSENQKGARTIGLEHLKLGLVWQYHETSKLVLNLRPDAVLARDSDGNQNKPVDTRAGDLYKTASPIQLLDSYQMLFYLGPTAHLAIGVWEELVAYEMSYNPLLAYGLLVQLPQYFSGFSLSWGGQGAKPRLPGTFEAKFAYELIFIQGDNDRSEQIGGSNQAFEEAPVADDPYVGGAARMLWWPFEGYRISMLLGYGVEKSGLAKSTQTYGDLGLLQQLSSSIRPVQLNWNARYLLESFEHPNQKLAPLYQFSFSGTSSIWVFPEHRLLLGAHIGRSERHASTPSTENILHYGHQMDLGWDYHFAPGLNLQLMLSEEHREIVRENDQIEDAFRSLQEVKKMLRRFAIAIQYQVDQGL